MGAELRGGARGLGSPARCVLQRCPVPAIRRRPGPQKLPCASRQRLSLSSPPVTRFLSAPRPGTSFLSSAHPHAVFVQASTRLAEILRGPRRRGPLCRLLDRPAHLQTFCPTSRSPRSYSPRPPRHLRTQPSEGHCPGTAASPLLSPAPAASGVLRLSGERRRGETGVFNGAPGPTPGRPPPRASAAGARTHGRPAADTPPEPQTST